MALSIDSVLQLELVEKTLAEGTGKGVQVALLDTGVEISHPALENSVKGCWEVKQTPTGMKCEEVEGLDPVGHGTACAGIIHQHAPEAEIFSIRVIGGNAQGTGEQFVYGLHWAIEQGFKVLNLSLGTLQHRYQAPLLELVDRAYYSGICVVAAAHNRHQVSFPSQFASLIAVDNQSFESDPLAFNYILNTSIETEGHGVYVRAPSSGGQYKLWTGTSFATPHITAVVARLLSVMPELTPFEVKTLLRALRANR
ncbi:MAG: S8 family serine peptidase [Candidatus Omnitrophica bacterium]|nr:S8 family serine peptidase [Candidatus Omnitrophota bacterium]